ncbi:MAG: hypothetical protein D4S02_13130 [Rhodocyclaceae bacterium]|nr:MAG: hypothetical protein D4S02_13130 [Rhodocyclaceae bacterium]
MINLRSALLLLCLSAASAPAVAQTKLVFTVFFPPGHFIHKVMQDWAADVEIATERRVKIEFPAGSLAPPPQQMSAVQSGIADIAMVANLFIRQKAPLIEFSSLPWMIDDAEAASQALWSSYSRFLADKKQFPDVQLLSLFHFSGGYLYSLQEKAINSTEELKNRRMWALPGPVADLLKGLGISPITGPAVQVSDSVSRGIVDGYFGISLESATDFKAAPYTKAITHFPRAVTSTSFSMFMNKSKWASLSEKDRAAILAVAGGKLAVRTGKAANRAAAEALATMTKEGIKVYEAAPSFYADLQKAAESQYRQYYQTASANGVDGKLLVEFFLKEYDAAAKH